jgi:hypothetical protein
MHPRITAVQPLERFQLSLEFSDGSHGVVDLEPWIIGRRGVFLPLQAPDFFARVAVDAEAGTVVWPNGVDLDPDMLYEAAHSVSIGGDQ